MLLADAVDLALDRAGGLIMGLVVLVGRGANDEALVLDFGSLPFPQAWTSVRRTVR